VDDTSFRADPEAMRGAITDSTILLVGSAPSFAHGVVDPIPQIGALALEKNLLFHVDACVGGFQLAYMRKLGYQIPPFDLSIPGVTSLSVDLHKYGYASRGASIILYKNKDIRRYQFFACASWPGYIVVNPALANSKTGGPLAAAWAVMNYLGDEGYMQIMQEVMSATEIMIAGIECIPGLKILGQPDMCMFAVAATTDKINVYRLADKMKEKGWHLQPQFRRDNSPANLHISLNRLTVPVAENFLKDFEAEVEALQNEELDKKTRNLYKEIEKLSLQFDDASFFKLAELAGVTGDELPDDMAQINLLLEALPHDVAEFMLTEFLNNLMVPERV
jgi:glutamate/tyrosine decarboxylase-like PLP-dependent enzyme